MFGSEFKQERKREKKNETKQQQQQQKRTNETNALGARIFSVSYLLSRSQAPLSREQRAQGGYGTTQRAPCDSCTNIQWQDSDLKYALKVKEIWWSSQQKRNLSS